MNPIKDKTSTILIHHQVDIEDAMLGIDKQRT